MSGFQTLTVFFLASYCLSYLQSGKSTIVSVERAKFEMKGHAYDATKKPKKLGKKELEKIQRRKDKLLAWIPDKVLTHKLKSSKKFWSFLGHVKLRGGSPHPLSLDSKNSICY